MTVAIAGSPALLRRGVMSDDERGVLGGMLDKLSQFQGQNALKASYYEGTQTVKQFGIAIPPQMQGVKAVSGWSGTTVDVLEERLDWEGWTGEDVEDLGLREIFQRNRLNSNSGLAHLDALIYGVAFVAVGTGGHGEPSPLVTVESPRHMTGTYDPRLQRLSSAVWQFVDPESQEVREAALYLPDETVRLGRSSFGAPWVVLDRDEHGMGRVPVARMTNKARAGDLDGRSEITEGIRYYTDHAVRTLLAMEVNREFYTSPQRYVLGADEEAFVDQSGNPVPGWQTIMGRVLALGRGEDGEMPQVGQFPQATQGPYADTLRVLAQKLSAEAGIPPTYLGFASDQAASADAIRAMESRLVKRAERRQVVFGDTWLEVAHLALLVRDGELPENFFDVANKWRDAATPTRSAAADEAMKYAAADIVPRTSSVLLDRAGFSPQEQRQIEADRRREGLGALVRSMGLADVSDESDVIASKRSVDDTSGEDAKMLKDKFEALGIAIRAGVDPTDAANRVGLAGTKFTGGIPVSIRMPEGKAEGLEDR